MPDLDATRTVVLKEEIFKCSKCTFHYYLPLKKGMTFKSPLPKDAFFKV